MNKQKKKAADAGTSTAARRAQKGIDHMKYNTKKNKSTRYRIMAVLAVTMLAAAIMVNVFVKVPGWEPDVEFPMANAKISWLQTFYSGSWGEAE